MKKKVLFIFLSFVIAITTYSQTKKETEDWLLQKLRKYTKESTISGWLIKTNYTKYTNYKFSFDEEYLVVSYNQQYFSEGEAGELQSCTEKLPIYDFESILINNITANIFISTKGKTVLTSYDNFSTHTVSTQVSFLFNSNAETDLQERMQKAFVNLKKFYAKPKSKEVFR